MATLTSETGQEAQTSHKVTGPIGSKEHRRNSCAAALIYEKPRTDRGPSKPAFGWELQVRATPLSRVGVACAGLVAGLSVAAVPAIAKPIPNQATPSPDAHPSVVRPSNAATPGFSQYLGGYDVQDTGNLTATSIVQVPNAKCANQKDYEHLFLGQLLVPASGAAYQGGSTDATAAVAMTCMGLGSAPFFYGQAYDTNGEDNYVSVHPGDLVETQVSDSYGGNTTATITDLNSGETASSTGASTGNDTQLYLGAEPDVTYEQQGPLVDYVIPRFTPVKFNDTVINGNEWSLSGPTAYSLEQNSDIQIKTASVPSAPTYSFTLTEKHTK